MQPHWIVTVLMVSSYCVVIFRFFMDYGGKAMQMIMDIIAYFQADPGRIMGYPFLVIAVGLNIWLVYDYFRRRRRTKLQREAAEGDRTLHLAMRNALQYNALATAINELRKTADLPAINFFDEQTIRQMACPPE